MSAVTPMATKSCVAANDTSWAIIAIAVSLLLAPAVFTGPVHKKHHVIRY